MGAAMRAILLTCLLATVALAGCTQQDVEDRPTFNVDFATPGVWNVSGPVDYIWVWAHNARDVQYELRWNLTLDGGQPLPEGWNFTYSTSYDIIEPADTTFEEPQTGHKIYADWAWAIFRLEVPMDAQSGQYPAEVHTGFFTKDVVLGVPPVRANVTELGDQAVATHLEGRFWDSGEVFWQAQPGEFGLEVGSGELITGFSYGALGLADRERVVIVVPPGLGYGFDQPEDDPERAKFNGEALEFTLELVNNDPNMTV